MPLTVLPESLGNEYSETHILDLELTWEESEPRTPLVCILSTGSDPTNQIIALAKLKNICKLNFFHLNRYSSKEFVQILQ